MTCPNCGNVNRAESLFCINCGSRLASPSRPAEANAPTHATSVIQLRCLSGPDAGKLFSVGVEPLILGRVSGVGYADSSVAEQHVMVSWKDGLLHFRAFPGHQVIVGDAMAEVGKLVQAQKFRVGRSTWVCGESAGAANVLESIASRLHQLASTDKLEGFSLTEMFSEVFKRRAPEEIDDYFTVGASSTTPRIEDVHTGWPKPWFFLRALALVAIVYFGFTYAWLQFRNTNLIPGLIMMGSLAMPLATVFLFWEMNTPKNVPFHRVLTLICLGGVISLVASLFGFQATDLDWLGASQAGIVEEVGKLLAVVVIIRHSRYPYILNGLLFGAAVGAGFAVFESSGYAFNVLMEYQNFDAMQANIQKRALLSPLAHVAWTAITAGALWRSRNGGPLTAHVLAEARFWKAFLIPVILHMIWNSPLPAFADLKYIVVGLVGWFVVFALVQQGLKQVREIQLQVTRETLTTTQRLAAASGD